jgi:hypothetical protein
LVTHTLYLWGVCSRAVVNGKAVKPLIDSYLAFAIKEATIPQSFQNIRINIVCESKGGRRSPRAASLKELYMLVKGEEECLMSL